MFYMTNDGERFYARNATAFVHELRKVSHVPSANDQEFMIEVAARARMQNVNWTIPTDSVEHFVDGLISAGLVKPVGN